MGIKGMLLREDFYKILLGTIIDYTHKVLHREVRCSYEPFVDADEWYINSALGFVSRNPTPKGVKTYMRSEYNVRGSLWKNIVGKLAVDIITTLPKIGTIRKIYVSKGIFDQAVFIVPQNRSIRFYNYETMTVDCIVKTGFTSKYFDNQAAFRHSHNYDFLNPMLGCGDGWFREPVLEGHPLIRTTKTELFNKGTSDSLEYLKRIATDTLKYTDSQAYIENLKKNAIRKIQIAKEKKGIVESETAKFLVEIGTRWASIMKGNIPTCISHGDFQSGNIWIKPNGKTLIYDWETAGRRSVWYDSATLSYSLRRAQGWGSMLEDTKGEGMMLCVPDGLEIPKNIKGIMGVLLLEDILFYLDDMLELPDVWGRDVFDGFIANIKSLNWQ